MYFKRYKKIVQTHAFIIKIGYKNYEKCGSTKKTTSLMLDYIIVANRTYCFYDFWLQFF